MTLKSQKTRPKFFQDFQSSNQHGTVVKSPFFLKTRVLWARFPVRRDVYVCIHTMKEYTWRQLTAFAYLIDLEGLFIQSFRAQTSQQAAILRCFSVPIALSDCLSLYQTSVVPFLFQRLNYLSPVSP